MLFADLHTHSPADSPATPGDVAVRLLRALGHPRRTSPSNRPTGRHCCAASWRSAG
ncbi:hypothetical protein GXW82_08870 [Streptacidiphilus sp. 4-A2]|nr:hypothetical protein [Streptacidiphilus sp. 4-A2]